MLLFLFTGCKKENESGDQGESTKATQEKTTAKATSSKSTAVSSTAAKTPENVSDSDIAENNGGKQDNTGDKPDNVIKPSENEPLSDDGLNESLPGDEKNAADEDSIDLAGKTFLIGFFASSRIPTEDHTSAYRRLFYRSKLEIEKKYNCKIAFTAPETQNNTLYRQQLMEYAMSGTEERDLILACDNWIMPAMVETGYCVKYDDYVSKDSEVWKELIGGFAVWKGYNYGMTDIGNYMSYMRSIYYNENIVGRAGFDIWGLVESGNWTWENFLEVARQTTADFNGDGIVDQWGLLADPAALGLCLVYSNGGSYVEFDGENYKCTINSPQSIKALQVLSDLYNIYKVTEDRADWMDRFRTGHAAMTLHTAGGYPSVLRTEEEAADKYIAPIPKGPDKDTYISGISTYIEMYFVPTSRKDIQNIVMVMTDLFYTTYVAYVEESNPLLVGAETTFINNRKNIEYFVRSREVGEPSFTKTFIDIFNPLNTTITNNILKKVIKLETSVSTALGTNVSVLQDIIDSAIGK